MNRKSKLIVFLLAIIAIGSSREGLIENYIGNTGKEGLLRAALLKTFGESLSDKTELVIMEDYSTWGFLMGEDPGEVATAWLNAGRGRSEELQEAIQDFCQMNLAGLEKKKVAGVSLKHQLISVEEVSRMFPEEGDWNKSWASFRNQFPGTIGITYISQPGYSKNGKLAVVYIAVTRGVLAASGFTHVFEYVNGDWQEKEVSGGRSWIS